MPPLELDQWGEGGPPLDYDPQAPTGPVPLTDVSEAMAVTPATDVPVPAAPMPEVPVPAAPVPDVPGAAAPEAAAPVLDVPEATVPEAPAPEVTAPEVAAPEVTVPEVVATEGENAVQGGSGPHLEQTPPGLKITDAPEKIGYPREVVPGAELVKRVSSGEGTQLPHWADPPTGEVPRALAGAQGADDELQAWRLLGSRGLRWREDVSAWSDGPGVEDLVEKDEGQVGPAEAPPSDPFSFDEDFERLERQRAQRASAASADTTVEIVAGEIVGSVGGSGTGGSGTGGSGTGGTGAGEAVPGASHGQESGNATAAASGPVLGGAPGGQEGSSARQAMPQVTGAGSETGAGGGPLPLFVEPVGKAVGAAGTAAAGPGGVAGGTGEGVGAQAPGPPGPSASGGEGEMADRTATRMPRRAQSGLGRAGRGPGSRRVAESDAKAAATRHSRAPYDLGAEAGGPGRNLAAAAGTGLLLAGLFVICYVIGPVALVGLATVAIAGCALEAFAMFQRAGFRPATLVGTVGSGGAVLAAYWKGTAAMPEVFVVVLFASLAWYLARVVEARPVVNVAVTIFGFAWVGVLGSFSALLLQVHQGSHLFLGAVVPTVAADLVAWFVGSRVGRHPMAPATSPSKTWEGFVGGAIAALAAGAVIGSQVAPWGGVRHGLELGLVVALLAPLGDLVQSMVKRDLRLKDSGAMLPGHGGLLDRFDSLLFVLPATYFLVLVLHIVK